MDKEKVGIKISSELFEKIKEYVENTDDFESVEDFIEFVLETVIEEESEGKISEEDEEKVKERLRSLGYL